MKYRSLGPTAKYAGLSLFVSATWVLAAIVSGITAIAGAGRGALVPDSVSFVVALALSVLVLRKDRWCDGVTANLLNLGLVVALILWIALYLIEGVSLPPPIVEASKC